MSKEEVKRQARKYFPFVEDYSPEIADEMKGTAEGAGCKLEEIVMMTAFCEMYYPRAFAGGCTSFAATENATADGRSYIGQTNDDTVDFFFMDGESYAMVLFERPSGPNVLSYTYAGVPSMLGMNSEGIGLCLNALMCEENTWGVPGMVIAREVLHQKTLTNAIGAILRAKRANSLNFLLADRNGEICDVEATPTQFDYFYVKETFAHANHFLSNKFAFKRDVMVESLPNSITRYIRMRKLMETNKGKINFDKLVEFTKDHVNYPHSICSHPDTTDPVPIKTFDGLIMVPKQKELWIARGNPCKSKYERYSPS